ncbi:hypothetical protein CKK33_13795 [Mucilaginibacter sp. MD40]|uniref:PKD domain-containing protein n=1 Tax=Mucilaginibacter sp. MD40 TaxID=2029590 RepID=UPI000BACC527|nr:PKD domain-containing protein [Mucilaginibacter sp. MD40]PAW94504.1 hypothetical protein CKK33_13795 [Mucilaginibacter sp. MD40]
MGKTFTKGLLLIISFLLFKQVAFSQTINIGTVDPGPYGQGSTIAVPITVTGCINDPANVFNLYLSDANGNFGSPTLIGSAKGFYVPFINGIIPNNAAAGTNYRVRVASSIPSTPGTSAVFSINAVAGIKAGAASFPIKPSVDPEVYGSCNGGANNFPFTNTSEGGNPATANFYNELTKTDEGTFPLNTTFAANAANYTVTVKTQRNGVWGIKAYQLINNIVNNSFTITGNGTVCQGSGNTLQYNVDITTDNGIQKNYPGLTYKVTWGDGTSSTYTFCDIVAANGKVSHPYIASSCGSNPNGKKNVFQIDIQPLSIYCDNITQPVTTYAKVIAPPQNKFDFPEYACTNTAVTFVNRSAPGDDPSSPSANCQNVNARWSWYVDGVLVKSGYTLSQPFVYTFTTNGEHDVLLHYENTNGLCDAADLVHKVCVQNTPTIDFTLPAQACLASGPVPVVNTSVIDNACNTTTTYKWVQTAGPTNGVTFNAGLKDPILNFTQIGVYSFRQDIITPGCGTINGPVKTIVVNTQPIAKLPSNTICSVNTPVSFDPNSADTPTNLDGTAQPEADTYTWVLGNGATFAPGSDLHTQYPKIIFPTTGTYTITVTHKNNCGVATDSQQITVADGPVVDPKANPNIVCEGNDVNLSATPGPGGIVTSVKWSTTTGGAFADANNPVTTYTPSAADISAGSVVLTYTVTTTLAGACKTVAKTLTVTIIPKANVNSSPISSVCSGKNFNYTITSPTATNFNWTATLTSGTATGFGATGSGNTINDLITNTGTTNAVITYTITPSVNGCPGNPFTLTLTVLPQAVAGTATPDQTTVCANSNQGIITLSGYVGNITWQVLNSGGTWTDMSGENNATYTFKNLSQTTQFRAMVSTGTCEAVYSNPVTINVNPQTPVANAGGGATPVSICNQTTFTLHGNDPGTFSGKWTVVLADPQVNFANPNDPNTLVTGLVPGKTYTFRWTISGIPPCADSQSDIVVIDKPDVRASFTSDTQICGPGPVTFTNTSTPDISTTQYLWDFGDGSLPSTEKNPPPHYFPVAADKSDVKYTVKLTIVNNCSPSEYLQDIIVSPELPAPSFSIVDGFGGCGKLTLSVKNTSPGNNRSYTFVLKDEKGNIVESINKTDVSDAIFQPHAIDHQATWTLSLKAVNNCGKEVTTAPRNIQVSPSGITSGLQAKDGKTSFCIGDPVTFENTSTGGTFYYYNIYNSSSPTPKVVPASTTADFTTSFDTPGTYFVSVKASNPGCGTQQESAKVAITVYPKPKPSFTYVVNPDNTVTFTNTTQSVDGTPPESFIYTWDFGDGSAKSPFLTPPVHQYDYVNSPYTVTLTAKSPTGCLDVSQQKIEIKFLGELFLPNAFQPSSSVRELQTFKAKGQKLKEWRLQVFNNWGQLMWQTTALDSNGSPTEGWDGTYNGVAVPQGTYIWQATARFTNGSEWKGNSLKGELPKRTGVIHLIR